MTERVNGSQRMSRRRFLGNSAIFVTTVAGFIYRYPVAEKAGRILDFLTSPEKIIPNPIPVLIPRDNNTPTLKPQEIQGPPNIINIHHNTQSRLRLKGLSSREVFQLPQDQFFQSEHGDPVNYVPKGTLVDSGTGIITTAEGLEFGKQEYCRFLRDKKGRLLGVGYENGLYTFNPLSHEWVRLLTVDSDGKKHLAKTTESTWEDLQNKFQSQMIIVDIAAGTNTLVSIGYRPFAAVLSSTRIPEGKQIETSQIYYARNAQEVTKIAENYREEVDRYFVTNNGDIVKITHTWAKAGETFDLFCQLYSEYVKKVPSPVAKIPYDLGNDAKYEFSINRNSLEPNTILDTTFQIMQQVGFYMEGISQRYVNENSPYLNRFDLNQGLEPTDLFSNSLGITEMLAFIRLNRKQITDALSSNTNIADIEAMRNIFMHQVIQDIIMRFGVEENPQIDSSISQLGIMPLVPSKVSGRYVTPTHLNLSEITPNNPKVEIQVTRIPTWEVSGESAVDIFNQFMDSLFNKLFNSSK